MATTKRGQGKAAGNPVVDAVERLGGIIQACAVAETTTATMYDWQRKGVVSKAPCVLRLAAKLEPADVGRQLKLARKLAGLED